MCMINAGWAFTGILIIIINNFIIIYIFCKIISEIIISVRVHRWMRLILSMLWMRMLWMSMLWTRMLWIRTLWMPKLKVRMYIFNLGDLQVYYIKFPKWKECHWKSNRKDVVNVLDARMRSADSVHSVWTNQRMVDPEWRNNVVRGSQLRGNLSNDLFTLWLAVNIINQHENTITQESKCPSASVSKVITILHSIVD